MTKAKESLNKLLCAIRPRLQKITSKIKSRAKAEKINNIKLVVGIKNLVKTLTAERKARHIVATFACIIKQVEKPGAKRSQKTSEKEEFRVNIV